MIIEDKNILTEEEKVFFDTGVLGEDFPFFIQKEQVENDFRPYLSHAVLVRPEVRTKEGFNSTTGHIFESILKRFCKKHNIEMNEFLRCSVNICFYNSQNKSLIHRDHEFEHKQIILYLNDIDGDTVIINDDKTETNVKPEKFKAVCFDGVPHYMYYPKQGYRAIVVFTFR